MQRSRNFIWMAISYGMVVGVVADPTRYFESLSPLVSLNFESASTTGIGIALFLGLLIRSNVLKAFSTFVHELGHSIAVGITGGSVQSLRMQLDTSGTTSWSGRPTRFTRALVAVAGPLANAFVFAAVISALDKGFSAKLLLGLAGVLAIVALTSIRNIWGWVLSLVLIALLISLGLALSGSELAKDFGIADIPTDPALHAILFAVTFNAGIGLRYSWRCRNPREANMDEYKFSKAIGLPTWIGGHLVLIANAGVVAYTLKNIFSLMI
jgi:hypothetical protein